MKYIYYIIYIFYDIHYILYTYIWIIYLFKKTNKQKNKVADYCIFWPNFWGQKGSYLYNYVEYIEKNAKPTVGSNYLWGGKQVVKEACRDFIFLFFFPFYLKNVYDLILYFKNSFKDSHWDSLKQLKCMLGCVLPHGSLRQWHRVLWVRAPEDSSWDHHPRTELICLDPCWKLWV